MPYLNDRVYDNGLTVLDTEANVLHICTQEPTDYTGATATYTKGNKTALSIGAPAAGSPNGRQVTVASISDGSVTGTGTVTHWAIVDTANSRLLATGALAASQAVTSGNTFTLAAFTIRIPAAGSPVGGQPAVGQTHALTATALAAGSPVVGQPAAAQAHALLALGLAFGAPELGTPALEERLPSSLGWVIDLAAVRGGPVSSVATRAAAPTFRFGPRESGALPAVRQLKQMFDAVRRP